MEWRRAAGNKIKAHAYLGHLYVLTPPTTIGAMVGLRIYVASPSLKETLPSILVHAVAVSSGPLKPLPQAHSLSGAEGKTAAI